MILQKLFRQQNDGCEYIVKSKSDISHIGTNKVIGDTSLLDDADRLSITFKGSGNILFLEKGIKHLKKLQISFTGDNSLIYISKSKSEYNLMIEAESNSVCYFGPHLYTNKMKVLRAKIREGDFLLTGADGLFSMSIEMDTLSQDGGKHGDILIGNHVWLGQGVKVYGGSVIHSGAVIGAQAIVDGEECEGKACWITRNGELVKLTDNIVFTKDSMRAVHPDALELFDRIDDETKESTLDFISSDPFELAGELRQIQTAAGRLKHIRRFNESNAQERPPQLSDLLEWDSAAKKGNEGRDNKIIGSFNEEDDNTVVFEGSGNILYIEPGAQLKGCRITFHYDNSIVYISRSDRPYHFRLYMHYGSTVYFGQNIQFSEKSPLRLNASEGKSILIGDNVRIGRRVWIRTSDQHPVYDIESGQRINKARSVVIGSGARIKSDTVIRKGSVITSRKGQTAEHLTEALIELEKATTPEDKLSIMKLL